MNHTCVPCRREYRPEKNGFVVEQTMDGGRPYKLWHLDKWKCHGCGHEMVIRPGPDQKPLAEHFDDDYATTREAYPPALVMQ